MAFGYRGENERDVNVKEEKEKEESKKGVTLFHPICQSYVIQCLFVRHVSV